MSPKLLVSVRDAAEVVAALDGGADWIDLKEPSAGPLAAVDLRVAQEAVQALAGRRTLSAALGELRDWHAARAVELLDVAGISVVKLGLAGCTRQSGWQQQWQAVAEAAANAGKQLVPVIYADWQQAAAPSPEEVVELARNSGSQHLLIDTYDKSTGTTFDHFSGRELEFILHQAQQAALTTVLAGSLSLASIGQLPISGIDMVAVRGAICSGDRTGRVNMKLVKDFRQSLVTWFTQSAEFA